MDFALWGRSWAYICRGQTTDIQALRVVAHQEGGGRDSPVRPSSRGFLMFMLIDVVWRQAVLTLAVAVARPAYYKKRTAVPFRVVVGNTRSCLVPVFIYNTHAYCHIPYTW